VETTQKPDNGDAHQDARGQPFFRVTIEVRSSPGEAFDNLQEKISQKANAVLDFIRRGVDIRVETGARKGQNKAERINIE
jgi:hypothetical protein